MSQTIVVPGKYIDHAFIPDGQLPDVEGTAQLIITSPPNSSASIFDVIGKAPKLRTGKDIAAQIQDERDEWGEP
jgi:hypothetical protein